MAKSFGRAVDAIMKDERKDLRDRTKAFAFLVIRMYSSLSITTKAQVMGKQVLRSGTLVGANYREAYRARSKAEFIAKLGDCLKETNGDQRGQTYTIHYICPQCSVHPPGAADRRIEYLYDVTSVSLVKRCSLKVEQAGSVDAGNQNDYWLL